MEWKLVDPWNALWVCSIALRTSYGLCGQVESEYESE